MTSHLIRLPGQPLAMMMTLNLDEEQKRQLDEIARLNARYVDRLLELQQVQAAYAEQYKHAEVQYRGALAGKAGQFIAGGLFLWYG